MVTPPVVRFLRSSEGRAASTTTRRTREVVSLTGSYRTTRRTPLAGMARIDTNTSTLSFVRDALLELMEVPRVDAQPRTVRTDTVELFHPNNGILELVGERDETTGVFVIQVFDSTPFFATHTASCAKRTRL